MLLSDVFRRSIIADLSRMRQRKMAAAREGAIWVETEQPPTIRSAAAQTVEKLSVIANQSALHYGMIATGDH